VNYNCPPLLGSMSDAAAESQRLADDPIAAVIAGQGDATLAFVVKIDGPSYRPVGAAMAILGTGQRVGTLSSGCIEADIVAHASAPKKSGTPKVIRYGRGSPYMDIQLPCGGGMDVLVLPSPDIAVLERLQTQRVLRRLCALDIDMSSGELHVAPASKTGLAAGRFSVVFEPVLQVAIFGKGPEAATFAKLVWATDFPSLLLSPDAATLAAAQGCMTRHLTSASVPADLVVDAYTAVVMFFHDHDWEPQILADILTSNAFYIGAQGSFRAHAARCAALTARGVSASQQARVHGPVGLIPSARDATTLAVSVLAEILSKAKPYVSGMTDL
jgi:xanthine dehydrogenase accessory factor